jgi:DNA-binding MarR family transcriptional regulator
VCRERDPKDRRRVLLQVDEARLQQEVAPLYAAQSARLAEVAGRFSPAEQATIAAFLDGLAPDRRSGGAEMGRFRP